MSIPHQRITSSATVRPDSQTEEPTGKATPTTQGGCWKPKQPRCALPPSSPRPRDRIRIGQRRRGSRPRLHIQDVDLANWLSYDGRTDFDIQGQVYLRLTRPYLPGFSEEATRDPEVLTAFADAFAAVLTGARYPCQVTTSQGSPVVSRAPST